MVMHARKLPRIDDGYYDCHDYHELKNSNCERKLSRDRRLRDEHGLVSDRQGSPTYRHKHIPAERRKLERDRRDKYIQQDEYTIKDNSKFGEKYTNHSDRLSGNHVLEHKLVDSRTGGNASVSRLNDRDPLVNPQDYKKNSSGVKTNSTGAAKDPRVEAQRTALRVCGDWSEHVSSSGKRYFYNCKTEVSQWVKPKEWRTDELAKQGRLKAPTTATKGPHENSRNGVSSHDEHSGSPSRLRCERASEDSRRTADSDFRSRVNECKSDTQHRRHHSSGTEASLNEQTLSGRDVNNYQMLRRNHDRSSSVSSTPSSSVVDNNNGSPRNGLLVDRTTSASQSHLHNGTNDDGSGDDMDISPDMSPRQLADSHSNSEQSSIIKSAIDSKLLAHKGEGQQASGNADQSMIWGKALETLQTLQEVLERSRTVSHPGGNSIRTTIDSPRSITSQSSPRIAPPAQHIPNATEITDSSYSVPGDKSPAASEASLGQHSALSSAAESCSGMNVLLPQSLINFYDPMMVSHISNWPAEQLELRAHMAYRDGLVICGHHCGQVSTELKRDRSHVRIAEVQSTLIEHRILFLKQQISELETQDRNYSSGQT